MSCLTCVLVLVASTQTCTDTTLPGTVQKYFANLQNFFFVKSEIFDAGCFKFEKCTFLRLCLVCGVQKYLSSAAVRGSSVLGGLGQLGQTELSRSLCLDWRLEITTSHHVLCVSHITRYLSLREKETSLASAQPIPKEMQNM